MALAAGDQLTLQRSNINTDPALVLSITDDLGQTILAPSAFLDQAASTDQLYTLAAPRTGTYKITVEWPVGENGQNAGNSQPIQIMYSMTPGSQNSFQSLFASFKDLFVHEGDVLQRTAVPEFRLSIVPQTRILQWLTPQVRQTISRCGLTLGTFPHLPIIPQSI